MTDTFTTRPATKAEFAAAIEWAAHEGWNPGLDDLDIFHAADPAGFLMTFDGARPVASISVARYAETFGFLGFYIVHPDYRGQGIGFALWQAGMAHLADRAIALDGVVDQQDNYKRSGFVWNGRNVRFVGRSGFELSHSFDGVLRTAELSDWKAIKHLDHKCFGVPRETFLRHWLYPGDGVRRFSLVAQNAGDRIDGFVTWRACRSGFKIGPLFAADDKTASALLAGAAGQIGADEEITLDVPERNENAVHLAESAGMKPVFETARMVLGFAPQVAWDQVYGLTSFELG